MISSHQPVVVCGDAELDKGYYPTTMTELATPDGWDSATASPPSTSTSRAGTSTPQRESAQTRASLRRQSTLCRSSGAAPQSDPAFATLSGLVPSLQETAVSKSHMLEETTKYMTCLERRNERLTACLARLEEYAEQCYNSTMSRVIYPPPPQSSSASALTLKNLDRTMQPFATSTLLRIQADPTLYKDNPWLVLQFRLCNF